MKKFLFLICLFPLWIFSQENQEIKKQTKIPNVTNFDLGNYYNKFKKMTFSDHQSDCRSRPMGPIGYTFASNFYEGNTLIEKMEDLNSIYFGNYMEILKKIPYNVIENNSSSSENCPSELYYRKSALLDVYSLETEMYMKLFNNEINMRNDYSDFKYKSSLDSLNQINLLKKQKEDRYNELGEIHDSLLEKVGILKLVNERDSKLEKLKIDYKNSISSLDVEKNDKILSLPQKDFERNKSVIESKFYNLIREKKNFYETQISSTENFYNSKINILANDNLRNQLDEIANERKEIEDFDYSTVEIKPMNFDKQIYQTNADAIINEYNPKISLVLDNYIKEQQKKDRTKKIIGTGIGILGEILK